MNNKDDESKLKLGETINAIKIISNAVLIGVQRSLDRYGKKNNIPLPLRRQLSLTIQNGGEKFISNLSDIKDFGNFGSIRNIDNETLKEFNQLVGGAEGYFETIKNVANPYNPDYKKGAFSLAAGKIFSNMKTLYIGLIKRIIIVTDFFVSKIIDYVTQDAFNVPVNEITTNSNERVLALAAYLRAIAENPEQMEAIREISEAVGAMGIEFIDSIRPALDKMIEKLNETSQKVASQAAGGAMKTFIAISSSLIAEIPALGGMVDLVISLAIGFNSFMRVVRTFVENNSELAVFGAEALNKSIQSVKATSGRLTDSVNKFIQGTPAKALESGIKKSIPTLKGSTLKGPTLKGGSNKMAKSRKRIENSVRRFKNTKHLTQSKHSRTKKYLHY